MIEDVLPDVVTPKPSPMTKPEAAPVPAPAAPPAVATAPAASRFSLAFLARLTKREVLELVMGLALALSLLGNAGLLHRPHFTTSVTAPLKATLVYDQDGQTPESTARAIRGDADLIPALKALGCDWRAYPANAPTLEATGLKRYVDEAGGPPVLIIQVEGVATPPIHGKAPATAADVIATVHKLRGK